jgi:serralysin
MSPGVFEFRGTAGFAPSGNPELRLAETASGSTLVQFDADGNGTVDAEIRVAGVTGLTADDFVL